MNIIVTACHVPFISGGATNHIKGTVDGLHALGHKVELMRLPFQFAPEQAIHNVMSFAEQLDLTMPNGQRVDRVISLQFPGYGVQHPQHIVWLMHQHRAVYELFDPGKAGPEQFRLRDAVTAFDSRVLQKARHRFANSPRVAERLKVFNSLDSEPLLHPPALASFFRCAPAQPYIFYPSRLETLKRQELLIRAAALTRSDVGILIAGTGGQEPAYQELIAKLNLQNRVKLLGHITDAEKIAFYANCLGVFFGPFDEDYGYITLEAMLSAKPVITCTDSGGPLEFVVDQQTGHVVEPTPQCVAAAIDALAAATTKAEKMGENGLQHYRSKNINWNQTIEQLLSA
jgi:glycosyltransferase involved in cell wall biosynthesis